MRHRTTASIALFLVATMATGSASGAATRRLTRPTPADPITVISTIAGVIPTVAEKLKKIFKTSDKTKQEAVVKEVAAAVAADVARYQGEVNNLARIRSVFERARKIQRDAFALQALAQLAASTTFSATNTVAVAIEARKAWAALNANAEGIKKITNSGVGIDPNLHTGLSAIVETINGSILRIGVSIKNTPPIAALLSKPVPAADPPVSATSAPSSDVQLAVQLQGEFERELRNAVAIEGAMTTAFSRMRTENPSVTEGVYTWTGTGAAVGIDPALVYGSKTVLTSGAFLRAIVAERGELQALTGALNTLNQLLDSRLHTYESSLSTAKTKVDTQNEKAKAAASR